MRRIRHGSVQIDIRQRHIDPQCPVVIEFKRVSQRQIQCRRRSFDTVFAFDFMRSAGRRKNHKTARLSRHQSPFRHIQRRIGKCHIRHLRHQRRWVPRYGVIRRMGNAFF
ncbi:MAG: hypothetical protein J6L82_09920 [Alphaproteobacteria bacterium]|nr:hypothetical protein [Alphaproteobacteria bacterium]